MGAVDLEHLVAVADRGFSPVAVELQVYHARPGAYVSMIHGTIAILSMAVQIVLEFVYRSLPAQAS